MNVHKLVTGTTLLTLSIFATAATSVRDASADPPKVAAASAAPAVKRIAFKTATKPAMGLSSELKIKVKAALDKALVDFAKDKNTTKLMTAGAALGVDGDSFYRAAAAGVLSSQHSKVFAAGSMPKVPKASALPGSYSIDAGEVVSLSTGPSCGGEVQVAFTIRNRGLKLPAGVTAKLFTSLSRTSAPTTAIATAWVNLAALDAGATTTVQVPALRHNASAGSSGCQSGDIMITPTFVEAKGFADYRLRIEVTEAGPEATLLSGWFIDPQEPGGNGGADDCVLGTKCASGACSLRGCPPFSPPRMEGNDGACYFSLPGAVGY